jgi:hypothetical protein
MLNADIPDLSWRIGVEIELMAPKGLSRKDLAEAIAESAGGSVRRYFHLQSELSKVPGATVFDNLTLGFEAIDAQGQWIAQCVDDLTLQEDLDKAQESQPGWYRIVSDDMRLLQLILCQADAAAPLTKVLQPIAHLFGTTAEMGAGKMVRVADAVGNSVAIAAPLPGERERPCELITPPIDTDHFHRLESLLRIARSLGFTAPVEGATHLHFDATPLYSAQVLANLVNLLWAHGKNLRRLVGTNPNCCRLGDWPDALIKLVQEPEFRSLFWPEAQACLTQIDLTKYCDFNLKNIVHAIATKPTFEARIFPVWLESQPIIEAAALIEAILRQAIATEKISYGAPLEWHDMASFLDELPLPKKFRNIWRSRLNHRLSQL